MKLFVLFFLFLTLFSSCNQKSEKTTIRIATAANMQFAMDSIASVFELKNNIRCDISTNSSGMLTAQIEQGAPYDVFVSANMKYPTKLVQSGFGQEPVVYAFGKLAFVYSKQLHFSSIKEALYSPKIKRIAVAEKKTAPYGIAALKYLDSIEYILTHPEKIVYGESISQVNQYLKSKSVDAGFTSFSFIQKFGDDYNYFEVDPSFYREIKQGACILKHGIKNHEEESELFVGFLSSTECVSILKHFGYLVK